MRLLKSNGRRSSDQIPAIIRALRDLVAVCGMLYLVYKGKSIEALIGGLL